MKYIKGNQTYKIDECELIKIRLVDNEDFAETPWAARFGKLSECVLQNHAIAFTPFHSWGAVIPSTGNFNFIGTLEKGELVLHPEAWDSYIEHKVIDEEGNYIYVDEGDYEEDDEDDEEE
jgi:hypothetical protein